jgi:predicted permease
MLDNLIADITFALRWLRRSPGFTAVAVISLAIGIGFNTALFTIVDAVLFRPLPVANPARLVDLFTTSPDGDTYATSSYPDYQDLEKQNHVFSDLVGYSPIIAAVSAGDRSRMAIGEVVTGNFFDVLGIRAQLGRTIRPDDDRPGAPRVVMVSHTVWTRDFGARPDAIGRTLKIHGQPFTIVGVADRSYTGMVPMISAGLWIPMAYVDDGEPAGMISVVPSPTGNTRLERRGMRWMFMKGRLKEGATIAQATAELPLIAQRLESTYPATNKDRRVTAIATSKVHIHPDADRALLPIALGLMLVVGLVLLVACANVASMLLARASGRRREIAVRLAIGASRARLATQLLTESAVMAALGAFAGIALAWTLTQVALSIRLPIPVPLAFALQIDGRVLLFTTAVTVIAALIAGLAPALKASRPNVVAQLKGEIAGGSVASRRWTLRDGLVASQIAVTMVLLVTAGLLTRSLIAAQRIGIGFESRGLAVLSTELSLIGYDDARGDRLFAQAIDRVRALPGVESAALAERTPFAINYNRNNIFIPGRHQAGDLKGFVTDATRVDSAYFATLGVPIVQGRNFASADTPTSPGVVIVNEAFARKHWPNDTAIGKVIRSGSLEGRAFEIVGICADYKVSTIGESPTPYVHYAHSQRPSAGETILVRTRGDAGVVLAAMRREVLALEPNVVFLDNQTMEAQVDTTLMPARLGAMSVSAVGAVAMVLAAIGLYGVIAYSVSQRTREIGIRMALGAQTGSVVGLVMKQGLALAAAGVAVGTLFGLAAAKAVSGALYGVGFLDAMTWIGALVTLFGVSALANIIPARRAAIVDPSRALRAD